MACLLIGLTSIGTAFSGADFQSSSANPQTGVSAPADWAPPQVTLANPGAAIRGTIQLTASASDPYGSGVASVRFDRAVAGSGAWTAMCTNSVVPYSCTLETSALSDGKYEFRAVATDNAGYRSESAVSGVRIDNTAPTVAMIDPGQVLSGVLTLSAEASDAGSGIASVAIQRSPAGKSTWTEVCVAKASPYSCSFDTRSLAEGFYEFRAVALDNAGNSKTSAVLQNRRVSNVAVQAVGIQTTNRGATAGKPETGDTVTFTYSVPMDPASLLSSWNGASTRVGVVMADSGGSETLSVEGIALGAVALTGNYVTNNRSVLFSLSSMALFEGTVTVTLGVPNQPGYLRTETTKRALTWTPSVSARSLLGQACLTTPFTSAAERQF